MSHDRMILLVSDRRKRDSSTLFIGMWVLVMRFFRAKARLVVELNVVTGLAIRESPWGSAWVNGVSASNCVKVVEYPDGWVIRMMPLFGNGKLWFPRGSTVVGQILPGRFLMPGHRIIVSGDNEVRLYGRLAEFAS